MNYSTATTYTATTSTSFEDTDNTSDYFKTAHLFLRRFLRVLVTKLNTKHYIEKMRKHFPAGSDNKKKFDKEYRGIFVGSSYPTVSEYIENLALNDYKRINAIRLLIREVQIKIDDYIIRTINSVNLAYSNYKTNKRYDIFKLDQSKFSRSLDMIGKCEIEDAISDPYLKSDTLRELINISSLKRQHFLKTGECYRSIKDVGYPFRNIPTSLLDKLELSWIIDEEFAKKINNVGFNFVFNHIPPIEYKIIKEKFIKGYMRETMFVKDDVLYFVLRENIVVPFLMKLNTKRMNLISFAKRNDGTLMYKEMWYLRNNVCKDFLPNSHIYTDLFINGKLHNKGANILVFCKNFKDEWNCFPGYSNFMFLKLKKSTFRNHFFA